MHKELSYLSPEGFTVFTSHYHKNRGTCCKSACLHCPYGYTLKKHGLEFHEVLESEFLLVEEIMKDSGLAAVEWRDYQPSNILWIKLKGVVCGFLLKNHIVVKHVFLKPHFQDQALSKELIESYLFI